MRLLFEGVESRRTPEWEVEAMEKTDKAFSSTLVFTQNQERLACWNCAFFVVSFDQVVAQGDRQQQPRIGHQAVIIKGNVDAVGLRRW